MITEACFNSIPEIALCALTEMFGSYLIASVFMLIVVAYLAHKSGMPYSTSIPLAFLAAFSLYWITLEDIFSKTIALILVIALTIMGIALTRWVKR